MAETTTLSKTHVNQALRSDAFYRLMPEFLPLKAKIAVGSSKKDDGCGGCSETTRAENLVRDFVYTAMALRDDRLNTLKKHLGVDKMLVTAPNPRSGEWESRII